MEIQETFLPLTAYEREELKRQVPLEISTLAFVLLTTIALFGFMISHSFYFWILPVAGWLFKLLLSAIRLEPGRKDLRLNHKKSLRGQITGDSVEADEYNAKYFLTIGIKTFEVSYWQYSEFPVGEQVEIQYAPHSKRVFSIKRINGVLPPCIPETTIFEALDTPDEVFINRQKQKRVVRRMIPALGIATAAVGVLTLLAPAHVPFYKLASAGVLGLLAYTSNLAETVRSLKKDLKWRHKKVITTKIESKFTNLRPKPLYYVQIKGEAIEVPQQPVCPALPRRYCAHSQDQ